MKNPMATAIDLVAAGDHQAIADYIAKARQNERFAQFFELMMMNDMSDVYDRHTTDMLSDPRYDKTYLCVLLEKSAPPSRTSEQ